MELIDEVKLWRDATLRMGSAIAVKRYDRIIAALEAVKDAWDKALDIPTNIP